jgi:hypothetical protein
MTSQKHSPEHPSAARGRTSIGALLYGLAAAPCAWFAAQIFSAGLTQHACFPKYDPLLTPAFAGSRLACILALLIAMAVSASGALIAYIAWRRTRSEHVGDTGVLLDIGEGRSRFMALAGLLTSVGFLISSLFSLPAAIVVPTC